MTPRGDTVQLIWNQERRMYVRLSQVEDWPGRGWLNKESRSARAAYRSLAEITVAAAWLNAGNPEDDVLTPLFGAGTAAGATWLDEAANGIPAGSKFVAGGPNGSFRGPVSWLEPSKTEEEIIGMLGIMTGFLRFTGCIRTGIWKSGIIIKIREIAIGLWACLIWKRNFKKMEKIIERAELRIDICEFEWRTYYLMHCRTDRCQTRLGGLNFLTSAYCHWLRLYWLDSVRHSEKLTELQTTEIIGT